MVEAGANQLSEEVVLDCIFKGHAEVQRIIHAQHAMFRDRGMSKPVYEKPEAYPAELFERVKGELWPALKQALHTKGKFERKDAVSAVVKTFIGRIPDDQPELRAQVKKIISVLEEEILRDAVLRRAHPLRRPRSRRGARDRHPGGAAAPHPRLGAVHPRRDPGARLGHPRHPARRPDHRGVRRRDAAEVPAALQLPALLRRRGQVLARRLAARDRPRQPRSPRPAADAAGGGQVPLHRARGLRHPRVQRLVVDGHGVRRLAGAVRRRRAASKRRWRASPWA